MTCLHLMSRQSSAPHCIKNVMKTRYLKIRPIAFIIKSKPPKMKLIWSLLI